MGESIYLIDKHAAHERIIFNKLKKEHETQIQQLLTPATAVLSSEEYDLIYTLIGSMQLLHLEQTEEKHRWKRAEHFNRVLR